MTKQCLHIFGINKSSSVDGPGIRYTIFVQGCPRSCQGCHNPESQDCSADVGSYMQIETIIEDIIKDPIISGVSFSGGEPFLYPKECSYIVDKVKEKRNDLNFWSWSGWTYEELLNKSQDIIDFLHRLDVLVDGPFVLSEKDNDILWRGSLNQRVIDVKSSLKEQKTNIIKDSSWNIPSKKPKIKLHN